MEKFDLGRLFWVQEKLGLEGLFWAKRNLGDSSNRDCMFASKDYATAVSRPHSGVPVALAGYGKQGTLQRHGLVPDSMNNPDCELVVG